MKSQEFEASYAKLNPAQKQAVDAIEGPVMVVAGPGTGKTQILTLRIANILLKTDAAPEQILALTFTEAAAYNMRRRLAAIIGSRAYRVAINTFHGFCNETIKRYPEDFPRIIGSKSITEVDQVSIAETLIETGTYTVLKPFGDRFLYVRDIVSAISDLKREGITPDQFRELVAEEKHRFSEISDLYHEKGAHKGKMKSEYQKLERKIIKNEELAALYDGYQKALAERRQYDFNDMILEVLRALETNKTLLQIIQEEHQYILVDEHQDTNNAQNKIIERIMSYHPNPNLFVVGDEKQAIFRFQGASLENFQYFQRQYPSAVLIALTENYRSTESVLKTAEKLLPGLAPLQKNVEHAETPIRTAEFSTSAAERYFVAHDIKEKIDAGMPAEDIAVLYRNNRHAFPIARDLERVGVPCQIESDQDLFSQSDVQKLLVILRAIAEYGNDVHVAPLLHLSVFGIDPLDAYKVLRNAADRKKYSLYDLISAEKLLEEIDLSSRESVAELGKKLKQWVRESREKDVLSFFEHIVRDSRMLEDMLGSQNAGDRFDAVNALFDELRQLAEANPAATLQDFFAYLETVKKHNLFLKRKNNGTSIGKVRLMTVHRAKGLEFSQVYILHAVNGLFGGKIERERLPLIENVYRLDKTKEASVTNEAGLDDERRLFYVALTRAKENVTITYAREDESHRETLPSQFLEEIYSEFIEKIDAASWEERFKNDRGFVFASASPDFLEPKTHSLRDQQFVQELFEKQGLSPTALNNYLECPWKYFYQSLLRIPAAQTKHQLYGIAVHCALLDFFERLKAEPAGKEFLLASFERHLNRQPLAPIDFEESKEKGIRALSGWHDAYQGSWNMRMQAEYRIAGVLLQNDIRLTGVLDKVEWNDDETVTIVDYKTAKPKTRNEILGKTKNGTGDYFRQLVFYRILLNHYRDGEFYMKEGVIDFIEPDERGNYHREIFEISKDDVAELEKTIIRVAEEIKTLEFWGKSCGEKACKFCELRGLMN